MGGKSDYYYYLIRLRETMQVVDELEIAGYCLKIQFFKINKNTTKPFLKIGVCTPVCVCTRQ